MDQMTPEWGNSGGISTSKVPNTYRIDRDDKRDSPEVEAVPCTQSFSSSVYRLVGPVWGVPGVSEADRFGKRLLLHPGNLCFLLVRRENGSVG